MESGKWKVESGKQKAETYFPNSWFTSKTALLTLIFKYFGCITFPRGLISSLQLKKSYVVGGGGWWANPLQTISQGLVLTLLSRLALSLTKKIK